MAAVYPPSSAPPGSSAPPTQPSTFKNPTPTEGPVARWVCAGGALALSVGLGAYLYLVDPNKPESAYPQCPLKALTGIDCPGCGGLRATHSMLHGDIVGALGHNILALVIVPAMAYFLFRWVLSLFGKDLPKAPSRPFMAWAVPLFVLVFTVVRNIPNTPFYYFNSAN